MTEKKTASNAEVTTETGDKVEEAVATEPVLEVAAEQTSEPEVLDRVETSSDDALLTINQRNVRKMRQGVVVSATADKTCVVLIKERKQHAVYGKMITSTKKLHVHDPENQAGLGDVVSVMETRPISRLKRWRLVSIVEKAQ